MKNSSTLITRIVAITGLALGAFALAAIAQEPVPGWTPPCGAPPTCNTPAPINVGIPGDQGQSKHGPLTLNTDDTLAQGLKVNGVGLFDSLIVDGATFVYQPNGTYPKSGQVLMASTSADGTVVWGDVASNPTPPPPPPSGNPILSIANVVSQAQSKITSTTWTDISSLDLTVHPQSASSRMFITANVVAMNGSQGGDCDIGLFRNGTQLVAPFASRDTSNWEASPVGITYIDSPDTTSPVTYEIEAAGDTGYHSTDKGSGSCFINGSPQMSGGGGVLTPNGYTEVSSQYYGASSMTVMEIGQPSTPLSVSGMSCTYTLYPSYHGSSFAFSGTPTNGAAPYTYILQMSSSYQQAVSVPGGATPAGVVVSNPYPRLSVGAGDGETAYVPCTGQ